MMLEYIKTGRDTYFDIQVINEDPTSSVGKQTVVLKKVNIDSFIHLVVPDLCWCMQDLSTGLFGEFLKR